MTEDLSAILRTIREVEVSLERRYARAEGTILMIWGLVGATIFAFYQLVEWNSTPYVNALGEWIQWMWLLPMAMGYVASAIVGSRLGRMGADEQRQRDFRRGALPGILVAILATTLVLTQRYHYIYGGVTAISGLALLAFAWTRPRTNTRTTSLAIGATMTAIGATLLAWPDHDTAAGIASLTFLLGYLTLGTVKYRLGA